MLVIYLLAAAGFTVLTTEFLIVGLLPAIARDLHVGIAQAGLLVTLFAFTVALAGPFLTAFFGRFERKKLFIACLFILGCANTLAACASNLGTMVVARLLPALVLPVFWALASVTAIELSSPERAGKAVSVVTMGVVCATVFGIPIGTLVGDALGWRSAFGMLAALAFAKAVMLLRFFPSMTVKSGQVSLLDQMHVLYDRRMFGHVVLSILLFTAMFTAYTYLPDMLAQIAGFDGKRVGWTLMGFGAVGLLGNWLGGKMVDWNALASSGIFSILMAIGMLALVPSMHTRFGMLATLGAWGVAQAALFLVGHVRVMKAAPQAPGFAASLNISACNVGIGLGAMVGGSIINRAGLARLGLAGAAIIGAALLVTAVLMRAQRGNVAVQAAGRHFF